MPISDLNQNCKINYVMLIDTLVIQFSFLQLAKEDRTILANCFRRGTKVFPLFTISRIAS